MLASTTVGYIAAVLDSDRLAVSRRRDEVMPLTAINRHGPDIHPARELTPLSPLAPGLDISVRSLASVSLSSLTDSRRSTIETRRTPNREPGSGPGGAA